MTSNNHWNYRPWSDKNVKNESALGYMIGAILGDGDVSHSGFRLTVTDKEFADEFARLSRIVGFANCKTKSSRQLGGKQFYEARMGSIDFGRWFLAKKYLKHFRHSAFKHGFLRGLFDAEGSANVVRAKRNYPQTEVSWINDPLLRPKWRADFTNTDLKLLKLVNSWLNQFGFKSYLYDLKTPIGKVRIVSGHRFIARKPTYRVQLTGNENVCAFLSFVGPSIPSKRLVFLDAKVRAWNVPPRSNVKPCWKLKVPIEQIRRTIERGEKTMTDIAREQGVSQESVARWLGLRPNQVPQTLYPNGLAGEKSS